MTPSTTLRRSDSRLPATRPATPPDMDPAAPPASSISVIIPVMNEEANVLLLADEITAALASQPLSWECIWVDDQSTDGTLERLREVADQHPGHRVLQMHRNSGQSAALAAGFRAARGDLLATLDGDRQNDPADLPGMITALITQRVHMMNGIRARRHDSAVRRLASKIGNGFRNALTGATVQDVGCAIRVFRRDVVTRIPVWKGMHRFLPTLAVMQGYRIAERPVRHRARTAGKTKYGINNRLWVGLADTVAVVWMQRRLSWADAGIIVDADLTAAEPEEAS